MKQFCKRIFNWFMCLLGKHEWRYVCGNYQTNKDIFECENCRKQIEE